MTHVLFEMFDGAFKDKHFLSAGEISEFLNCSPRVVQNWLKRSDPAKRPPKFRFGHDVRFPKREFVEWLVKEQSGLFTE